MFVLEVVGNHWVGFVQEENAGGEYGKMQMVEI